MHHKERYVQAWTDHIVHLGNITINRVEGAHSRLKRLLYDSMGDLCICWDAMNNMKSINVVDHRFNTPFYKRLRGFVSTQAQSLIFDELKCSTIVGVDNFACGCTLRTNHGLVCACEIARHSHISGSIPLLFIHVHWKMLSISGTDDIGDSWGDLTLTNEVNALLKRFSQLGVGG
ncbi:hypothetical protein GmHk_12G034979 [Glycine max]|nr:hypothetical protein GmHk_12G034979 [Glycine max]